jgi:hypothetical protein
MRFLSVPAFAALALSACSPTEDTGGDAPDAADPAALPSDEPAPQIFAATAWRAVAEDGARYTTQLDPDGTYRDLRNGDPWQTGSWTYSDGEQGKLLCFTPGDENGIERCWEPERVRGDTMRATSDSGTTIELERVDYEPPLDELDDEE